MSSNGRTPGSGPGSLGSNPSTPDSGARGRRTRSDPLPAGILLVDKPAGPTSHDIVDAVRRRLAVRKVGHAGTLDPAASGLLVVLVGRPATRLQSVVMAGDKMYTAVARLGVVTPSHDLETEPTGTSVVPPLTAAAIQDAAAGLLGLTTQVPPPFSAIKVGGSPAYRQARRGIPVTIPPRQVRVRVFVVTSWEPPLLEFATVVGKGTYVRTLAHDLGTRLGCGAALAGLRRLAAGKYRVSEAITLLELERLRPASLRAALLPLPA